jgi:hypothetical protein
MALSHPYTDEDGKLGTRKFTGRTPYDVVIIVDKFAIFHILHMTPQGNTPQVQWSDETGYHIPKKWERRGVRLVGTFLHDPEAREMQNEPTLFDLEGMPQEGAQFQEFTRRMAHPDRAYRPKLKLNGQYNLPGMRPGQMSWTGIKESERYPHKLLPKSVQQIRDKGIVTAEQTWVPAIKKLKKGSEAEVE